MTNSNLDYLQRLRSLALAASVEIAFARFYYLSFLEEVENECEVEDAWEVIGRFDQAIDRAGKGVINENMIFAEGLILIEFFKSAEIILRYARIDANAAMQSWVMRKRRKGTGSDVIAIQIDQRLFEALRHTQALVAMALKIRTIP